MLREAAVLKRWHTDSRGRVAPRGGEKGKGHASFPPFAFCVLASFVLLELVLLTYWHILPL
jgi:hypothetical protein